MSDSPLLSPAPPGRLSLDYAGLREAGLARIRELAAETWTDHNVHDPGITLLEAFSYAMTELGLRLQLGVGDLLRSGEPQARAELPPAHRVLPIAPVTAEDLRRQLLDNPLVADALIRLGVLGEIAFYRQPGADPPFSFEPGTPPSLERAPLGGLYEVTTAFAGDQALNSNTYTATVAAGGNRRLELALPHWDEAAAAPFRAGAAATAAAMIDPGAGVWRRLAEPGSFFGKLSVDHDGSPAGPAILWVVLRLVDQPPPPEAAVPAILAASRTLLENVAAGPLAEFVTRVKQVQSAVSRLQRLLAAGRNLAEDPVRLGAARVQEIAIRARIEINGGTDLEALVAGIFAAIDRQLSPALRFRPLAEMLRSGLAVEQIFDGPLLRHGFLDHGELAGFGRATAIYVSDVLRLILQRRTAAGTDLVAQENPSGRDIVAVTDLRLSSFVNNRPVTTDARDCLRLVEAERYRPQLSLAKSRLVLVRDDFEVPYDPLRVEQLFLAERQRDRQAALPADPSPLLPEPPGEALPIEGYTPFQYELPQVYGLGEWGLADTPGPAGERRRAQQLQAKGYLHLFEQLLADHTAQLANLNRYFSPRAEEPESYFVRPLFELPGVADLLESFPAGGDWQAFVDDPDNPHRRALAAAAEDRDRFLDRRNRMLDHLLARLGEETVALGQELHRQARSELAAAAAALTPEQLAASIAARRQAVNARLMAIKAAFLAEAPELAARRLQSFGSPLGRASNPGGPAVLEVAPEGGAWRFLLALDGQPLLRSEGGPAAPASRQAAEIAGEEALLLAGSGASYGTRKIGAEHFYLLQEGTTDFGISPSGYSSITAAKNAAKAAAARFADLRIALSLTPLERRVRHLSGMRGGERRPLVVDDQLFTIVDLVAGDFRVDRWELRDTPGGAVLLESAGPFAAASDAAALGLARRGIAAAAQFGLDEWSYQILPVANRFTVELREPAGPVIARSPAAFATRTAAEQAVAALVALLHRDYGAEGFHLVEHLLLRPRQKNDVFLSLPGLDGGRETDPYSHRITLVFPSGYQRDFAGGAGARTTVAPHRFRDQELRRHLERMVRQACPAHLLPTLIFADRDIVAPELAAAGSFEGFETRYFTWLRSILVPGATATAARTARNALATSLNALSNEG